MQYILTEEEYKQLKSIQQYHIDVSKMRLQKLCSKIANEMPIKFWGRKEAEPWRCCLEEYVPEDGCPGYCDECPVQDICPREDKEWSK